MEGTGTVQLVQEWRWWAPSTLATTCAIAVIARAIEGVSRRVVAPIVLSIASTRAVHAFTAPANVSSAPILASTAPAAVREGAIRLLTVGTTALVLERCWRRRSRLSESSALSLTSLVHGKGLEPLRLAAAEPKASRGGPVSAEIRVNAGDGETRSHESARVETDGGQSVGNREGRAAVLDAAIERVTRALVTAADGVIPELVAERRAMREELDGLRRHENVVSIRARRRERP